MPNTFNSIDSLRSLYKISTIIHSDMELDEKFTIALETVRSAAGCDSASLFIHDDEKGRLEEVATVGKRVDLIESIDFDLGKGFSAWVAKQRRPVLIPNVHKDRHDDFRSFLSTPLITSGDSLIGVLNLGRNETDGFDEQHMELLEIIAGQLAHTIERSNYEHALLEKNKALENARNEISEQQKQIVDMEKYQTIGQMAVSLNHEINNPLTTIMGNIELLLMVKPDMDEDIRKKLNVVLSESKRIAAIVEKLREMKQVVVENYIEHLDEKMIDIHSSSVERGGETSEKTS